MQESANIVVKILPLTLSNENKEKAFVTIEAHMNSILKRTNTEDELRIFAKALEQCKKFSTEHNLDRLNKLCVKWNREGVEKLNEIRESQKSAIDKEIARRLQHLLFKTSSEISKIKTSNSEGFQTVPSKLDEIESSLMSKWKQYLSDDQIAYFLEEINNQRDQVKIKYTMIVDLPEIRRVEHQK